MSQTEFSVTGFLMQESEVSPQCLNSSLVVRPRGPPNYASDISGDAAALQAAHSDTGLVEHTNSKKQNKTRIVLSFFA